MSLIRRFFLRVLIGKLFCLKDSIAFYVSNKDIEFKESLCCDVDLMVSKIKYLLEEYKK